MTDRAAEEKLDYPYDERTRFSVRIEAYCGDHDLDPSDVAWLRGMTSLQSAQTGYMTARDISGLGASKFMPGEVFDEAGQHIARISYNGRLFRPEPLTVGCEVIAEPPPASADFGSSIDIDQEDPEF